MRRDSRLIAAALSLLLVVPAVATAHPNSDHGRGNIADRLDRQSMRIREGVESGALTRREARQLRREQKEIRVLARKMRRDDGLSKKERRRLQKRLDKASRHIRKLKHNDVERHRYYGHYDYNDRHDDRSHIWLSYYWWR